MAGMYSARRKDADETVERIARAGQEMPAVMLPETGQGRFGVGEPVLVALFFNDVIDAAILHGERHWRNPT